MLYYLSVFLTPYIGAFNVFSYHTVRAGGALITGFGLCLLIGPWTIGALRRLNVGQYIKKEHVADLHALHKGKSGTPTMGGTLIILSTCFSLLLWSTLTNRLLLAAVGMLCLMGAVGFVDDYIKLRRKKNDGLSARAKLTGQIFAGGLLGVYVVLYPVSYGVSYLSPGDVLSVEGVVDGYRTGPGHHMALKRFLDRTPPRFQRRLRGDGAREVDRASLVRELNKVIDLPGIFDPALWAATDLNGEGEAFLSKGVEIVSELELPRFNRLLLEAAAPGLIAPSPRHLQTKVGVPGMKDTMIPFGFFYVFFVILIITGASNAVNLTDGLDGLAVGASVISIFAFTVIAYVVSRVDWSSYLYVVYVPEASELTVFGSALLGAGLGFLWFNAHPAEVFMGDTGSLALGGVMGTLAVLTKQELLLPIVGGLFVIEALSVILQVASFKLTGRRIFRMAPLHHHFELMGWSESKVTIRFWILAFIFALMSLATLKLR